MRSPLWILAPFALAAGCGKNDGPVPVSPVSGQVLYGGKPAAGVQVFFFPTNAPTRPAIPANPHGLTGPDGKFTLSTYGDGDGAAAGKYQIILNWPDTADPNAEATTDRLLGWYDGARSQLTAQVQAGATTLPPISLPQATKPPGEIEGIPGRN